MVTNPAYQPDNDAPEKLLVHKNDRYHFSGKYFQFDADMWDLNFRATVASQPSHNRINFASFGNAVKNDVKEFILHGITGAGLSNSWAIKTITALKKANQFLVEKHGRDFSPLTLTRDDARSLEEHLSQSGRKYIAEEISIISRFAAFLRQKY